jgi:lipoic acid synthetase
MKVRLKMDAGDAPSTAARVKDAVHGARLNTVCEEASCPNLGHCWNQGTATFMIMGENCTRRCGFCDISTARPSLLDPKEPEKTARAVQELGLKHVVITSVDRDDLKDCGSRHFAKVIRQVREQNPRTTVEVLIPDFKGVTEHLQRIADERPDILNHNVETVPALFRTICPQSNYQTSIEVIRWGSRAGLLTKSGLILGLGESITEVREVIADLAEAGCGMLTIGQYLQPSPEHAPLKSYVALEVFDELKEYALGLGFRHVEAGPLVRSSYHAGDNLDQLLRPPGA